jgi:hypothetical protein
MPNQCPDANRRLVLSDVIQIVDVKKIQQIWNTDGFLFQGRHEVGASSQGFDLRAVLIQYLQCLIEASRRMELERSDSHLCFFAIFFPSIRRPDSEIWDSQVALRGPAVE